MLGGETDCRLTVSLMDLDASVMILETDDLVARKRIAVGAAYIFNLGLARKM